jgi:hypothetical protein
MALSLTDLRRLADAAGLKYFVDPNRNTLMFFVTGIFGRYQAVIMLPVEGQFLQFRTMDYLRCPQDHEHRDAVLRLMATLNYNLRMAKFGWDEDDGEIVVYADTWVVDGTVTEKQFARIMQVYFQIIDVNHARLAGCLETGQDPGEVSPSTPGALSDRLREALERLTGRGGKDAESDEEIEEL